jgi:predicted RNase H-like HicB family nuclease
VSRVKARAGEVFCATSKDRVEKHPDVYVAYPLGLKGVVVGEGDSYEEALADATSAIRFHVETFGPDVMHSSRNLAG